MREHFAVTIPAGGYWPDQNGGHDVQAFKWLRVHHRTSTATEPVYCSLAGPPSSDPATFWEVYAPGQRRVRNVGGIHDAAADRLHFLNADAAAVTIWVEVADTPIIDVGPTD